MDDDYIIVIVEFHYDTQKERTVSNEIRRAFLGLERSSPNIPKFCSYNIDFLRSNSLGDLLRNY